MRLILSISVLLIFSQFSLARDIQGLVVLRGQITEASNSRYTFFKSGKRLYKIKGKVYPIQKPVKIRGLASMQGVQTVRVKAKDLVSFEELAD